MIKVKCCPERLGTGLRECSNIVNVKKIQTKDEAIETVINNNQNDYQKIYCFAELWVKNQFKWFSADDLKEAYFKDGGSIPRQPKVFGGVFRNLSKQKLIFPHSHTVSKNPVAHGRILRTWISLQFKQKQADNARNKTTLKLEL